MVAAVYNFVLKLLSLSWLTGPIFDKELRVSSRRRRNYVLRFAYLMLLMIFLAVFWLQWVPSGDSGLVQSSRMAEAGKQIIAFIIWFQFIATQFVAGVMLSTSISDEIYNRTLGLLMTTPINSFQIVTGKLFSKLLQVILLLAISLPLLAIIRVFGGVPWMFIVVGLCITFTTVVFVGSLSLFFSILSRRAYVVIIMTIVTIALIFGVLPLLAAISVNNSVSEAQFFTVLSYLNPYVLLGLATERMASARMGGLPYASGLVHCTIMLGASAALLLLSVSMVRKVALRQATGQLGTSSRRRRRAAEGAVSTSQQLGFRRAPRRVKGSPVIWKELRAPVIGQHKIAFIVCTAIGLILLSISYAIFADEGALDEEYVHVLYGVLFLALGILFAVILPATCITSEKESRSWPLLLATTLTDWQILFGKFIGIVRRCAPVWAILFGHILLFTVAGIIHPFATVQILILVAGIAVFLSGSGFYFSARFKRTTTAVIANSALPVVLWGLLPLLMAFAGRIGHGYDDFIEYYIAANPFVHIVMVMDAAVRERGLGSSYWPGMGRLSPFESTMWMLVCMVGYMVLGLLFAWRAKCRFRRNIF